MVPMAAMAAEEDHGTEAAFTHEGDLGTHGSDVNFYLQLTLTLHTLHLSVLSVFSVLSVLSLSKSTLFLISLTLKIN